MIAAGKLDRRVRIEQPLAGDDGYNAKPAWATLATVWAQYIPSAGKEAREQMGRDAHLVASFRIRFSTAMSVVGPGHRLRYPATDDGQVWDIKSAVEIGRREGLEILAMARAA